MKNFKDVPKGTSSISPGAVPDQIDVHEIRDRIKYEDELLNNRTNLILVINGLMAIAINPEKQEVVSLIASGTILLINILWLFSAIEAGQFIHYLTSRLHTGSPLPDAEYLKQKFLETKSIRRYTRISPTLLFGALIPTILVFAWIMGIIISVR